MNIRIKNFLRISPKLLVLLIILLSLSYSGLNLSLSVESKANLLAAFIAIFLSTLMLPYLALKKLPTLCINSALIILILLSIELLFYFKIVENPGIRSVTFSSKSNKENIEYLDKSPFIKFKANTKITSMGTRGDDFTYTWLTDSLGYKNPKKILNSSKIDFLALGDSFTEGMGVATKNTWSNILSNKYQINVYNSGVQGYSASQMLGTLMLLKNQIEFQGIIIGAVPYNREKKFMINTKIEGFTGGIEQIRLSGRTTNNTFLSSFLRSLKNMVWITSNLQNKKYLTEISIPDKEIDLKVNPYWIKQMTIYKSIINWAKNNNKKVYLVQFPKRPEIYFSESSQGLNSINESQYYVELTLLKKEIGNLVEIIDLYPPIKKSFETNPEKPMYFEIDGHMNEYGHELVADAIYGYISNL